MNQENVLLFNMFFLFDCFRQATKPGLTNFVFFNTSVVILLSSHNLKSFFFFLQIKGFQMRKHLKSENSSPRHGKCNKKSGWLAGMLHVLDFHNWRTKNRPICKNIS